MQPCTRSRERAGAGLALVADARAVGRAHEIGSLFVLLLVRVVLAIGKSRFTISRLRFFTILERKKICTLSIATLKNHCKYYTNAGTSRKQT
jgi:hypothetical protein